jgi:hypothetical protein
MGKKRKIKDKENSEQSYVRGDSFFDRVSVHSYAAKQKNIVLRKIFAI